MDVVTINDANLGLSQFPVRVTTIEEDEKGILTITVEEFPDRCRERFRRSIRASQELAAGKTS